MLKACTILQKIAKRFIFPSGDSKDRLLLLILQQRLIYLFLKRISDAIINPSTDINLLILERDKPCLFLSVPPSITLKFPPLSFNLSTICTTLFPLFCLIYQPHPSPPSPSGPH